MDSGREEVGTQGRRYEQRFSRWWREKRLTHAKIVKK